MAWRLAAIALPMLLVACGFTDTETPTLGISNGTTLVVVLTINGEKIGEIRPGVAGAVFHEQPLPGLPWTVEARTVSGRLLASMTVLPGQVTRTVRTDGSSESRSAGVRVDLSCGRLDIWAGAPMLGPPPGPGVPGDCLP